MIAFGKRLPKTPGMFAYQFCNSPGKIMGIGKLGISSRVGLKLYVFSGAEGNVTPEDPKAFAAFARTRIS